MRIYVIGPQSGTGDQGVSWMKGMMNDPAYQVPGVEWDFPDDGSPITHEEAIHNASDVVDGSMVRVEKADMLLWRRDKGKSTGAACEAWYAAGLGTPVILVTLADGGFPGPFEKVLASECVLPDPALIVQAIQRRMV